MLFLHAHRRDQTLKHVKFSSNFIQVYGYFWVKNPQNLNFAFSSHMQRYFHFIYIRKIFVRKIVLNKQENTNFRLWLMFNPRKWA